MLRIDTGVKHTPIKAGIYGAEGIGKTTLAAQMPDPLFLDLEGGSSRMDVRRITDIKSWEDLIHAILEVAANPGICKTLVIDTADKAEQLCIDYVCRRYHQPSIEGFGYGKGYTYTAEEWQRLMAACDAVIAAGINVVIICHGKMRKQELPDEAGAFDRWELKLTRQVAPLVKEWADLLLFANYKTVLVSNSNNGTKKAQGGRRVMYTSHHPCWDAKNRFGLPDELDLNYDEIRHIFERADTSTTNDAREGNPTTLDKLRTLMAEAGITDSEISGFVAGQGYAEPDKPLNTYSDELIQWLIEKWTDIVNYIRTPR